mmetsp:Transcript_11549/g.24474  ORF Transcript_11549/g.24474 Transcript_11549/m.24474 type:complete len:572 (+) Transcript_11549:403-2118(+)
MGHSQDGDHHLVVVRCAGLHGFHRCRVAPGDINHPFGNRGIDFRKKTAVGSTAAVVAAVVVAAADFNAVAAAGNGNGTNRRGRQFLEPAPDHKPAAGGGPHPRVVVRGFVAHRCFRGHGRGHHRCGSRHLRGGTFRKQQALVQNTPGQDLVAIGQEGFQQQPGKDDRFQKGHQQRQQIIRPGNRIGILRDGLRREDLDQRSEQCVRQAGAAVGVVVQGGDHRKDRPDGNRVLDQKRQRILDEAHRKRDQQAGIEKGPGVEVAGVDVAVVDVGIVASAAGNRNRFLPVGGNLVLGSLPAGRTLQKDVPGCVLQRCLEGIDGDVDPLVSQHRWSVVAGGNLPRRPHLVAQKVLVVLGNRCVGGRARDPRLFLLVHHFLRLVPANVAGLDDDGSELVGLPEVFDGLFHQRDGCWVIVHRSNQHHRHVRGGFDEPQHLLVFREPGRHRNRSGVGGIVRGRWFGRSRGICARGFCSRLWFRRAAGRSRERREERAVFRAPVCRSPEWLRPLVPLLHRSSLGQNPPGQKPPGQNRKGFATAGRRQKEEEAQDHRRACRSTPTRPLVLPVSGSISRVI